MIHSTAPFKAYSLAFFLNFFHIKHRLDNSVFFFHDLFLSISDLRVI
nr:MAG TPA: hypothetical protein [Caudoviricetes sp.]